MAKLSKASFSQRLNVEELYQAFLNLEQREQVLWAGGLILALVLLIFLPITCASGKLSDSEKKQHTNVKDIAQLQAKLAEYDLAKQRYSDLEKKFHATGSQSLSTVLETLARDQGIEGHIDKLTPKNLPTTGELFELQGVEAKLSRLGLEDILEYLYNVETYAGVSLTIAQLNIKPRYDNRSQMDLTFQVSTIQLKGEGGE